jgi:hypothetical protein
MPAASQSRTPITPRRKEPPPRRRLGRTAHRRPLEDGKQVPPHATAYVVVSHDGCTATPQPLDEKRAWTQQRRFGLCTSCRATSTCVGWSGHERRHSAPRSTLPLLYTASPTPSCANCRAPKCVVPYRQLLSCPTTERCPIVQAECDALPPYWHSFGDLPALPATYPKVRTPGQFPKGQGARTLWWRRALKSRHF